MTLKIPASTMTYLEAAIRPLDVESTREAYRSGQFPNHDRCKDVDKRYRWDLLYAAIGSAGVCALYDAHAVNDTHIDSALRRIVPTLGEQK